MSIRGIYRGLLSLAIVGMLTAGSELSIADAAGTAQRINVTLVSNVSQTSQARAACQADGATVATAMAAYEAENPGKFPTMADLISSAHGGPYLQSAPNNPAYYKFSIAPHGVLRIATVKSLGPPIVYSTPVPYKGPSACAEVEALPRSEKLSSAARACQADGATVATAMAAYEAENPGKFPTMADLISSAHGGPYLQSAPNNPAYYKFSIAPHGVLRIATVKSLGPPIVYSTPVPYKGPSACSLIWVH